MSDTRQIAERLLIQLEGIMGAGAFDGALIPLSDAIESALLAAEQRGRVQGLREAAGRFDESDSPTWSNIEARDWLLSQVASIEQQTKETP